MSMRRTAATRLLILLLSLGAVLSLPGGLLAAVAPSPPGCSHCQMAGHHSGPCSCCPPGGKAGHCDNSGQNNGFNCHCSFSGPAAFASVVTGIPAQQVTPRVLDQVVCSSKLLTPNIFHPPRLDSQVWS